jgi:hypothetical protein
VNRGPTPAAFVAANVRGLRLDGWRVSWGATTPAETAPPERHALYFADVDQLAVVGFEGGPASRAGKLAAIGLDRVRDISFSGCRALPGTQVFVGHNLDPRELDTLGSGNDLRHAAQPAAHGWLHVPAQ